VFKKSVNINVNNLVKKYYYSKKTFYICFITFKNKQIMKKVLLTAAAVLSLTFVNAQDLKSKKGEAYLPVAGDWAISFNANGIFKYAGNAFNGNTNNAAPTVTNITNNAFVGKKFITDKSAYRVVANLGFGSNNLTDGVIAGTPVNFDSYKSSTFSLTAGLGKEWRRGSTRLQGFYGADALVGFSSTKWTETNNTAGNASFDAGTSINLGVTGFIGAEYFLFPKMSIGAQYNYGLQIASNGAPKYTPATGAEVKGESNSNFNLGNVTAASMNLTLHF
jgi:hypothetical protein